MATLAPRVLQSAKSGSFLCLPSIRTGIIPDVDRLSTSAIREGEAAAQRTSASMTSSVDDQASCSSSSSISSDVFGRQPDNSPKAVNLDQTSGSAQSSVPFSARQFWTSTFRQSANQAQPLGNGRRAYLVDTLALVSASAD